MKVKALYIGKDSPYFSNLEGKQILWLDFFADGSCRASLFTYIIDPIRYKEYKNMQEFFEDWTMIKTIGKMEYPEF